jgi:carbon monoxide dehydrogenase subunit G
MRINESVVVSAPPQTVWDYLADPENYLRFMSGLTRWEVIGNRANGLGARYRILLRVGAAEIGGLIEMVEWNEPYDQAWHSVTGVDQRGRWRIREQEDGRSKVEFRFAYGVIGADAGWWSMLANLAGFAGRIAVVAAAPTVRGHMRRSLRQLKRQIEHEQRRALTERRRAQTTTA